MIWLYPFVYLCYYCLFFLFLFFYLLIDIRIFLLHTLVTHSFSPSFYLRSLSLLSLSPSLFLRRSPHAHWLHSLGQCSVHSTPTPLSLGPWSVHNDSASWDGLRHNYICECVCFINRTLLFGIIFKEFLRVFRFTPFRNWSILLYFNKLKKLAI